MDDLMLKFCEPLPVVKKVKWLRFSGKSYRRFSEYKIVDELAESVESNLQKVQFVEEQKSIKDFHAVCSLSEAIVAVLAGASLYEKAVPNCVHRHRHCDE